MVLYGMIHRVSDGMTNTDVKLDTWSSKSNLQSLFIQYVRLNRILSNTIQSWKLNTLKQSVAVEDYMHSKCNLNAVLKFFPCLHGSKWDILVHACISTYA